LGRTVQAMGFYDLKVEADNDATFGGDKLVPS
jgi:hypothetical protein